jgi:hypothetical protein
VDADRQDPCAGDRDGHRQWTHTRAAYCLQEAEGALEHGTTIAEEEFRVTTIADNCGAHLGVTTAVKLTAPFDTTAVKLTAPVDVTNAAKLAVHIRVRLSRASGALLARKDEP